MNLKTFGRIIAVLLLVLLETSCSRGKPQPIKPGCRYEGRRYQEGTPVSTSEPCLQCRCTEGALRCRLRVCPRLPNPPPSGCRVRSPAENVCCAELVCGEARDTENTLQRSSVSVEDEADGEETPQNSYSEGCVHEGVRYGPGSAMMGSRRCEYCYCISGARRCIRPKCLLPLPGCTAFYAPHSCCPVAYNCTHLRSSTLAPISGNGCRVSDRIYEEGEMIRDIEWKAPCDNCFCAMGAVRCVPLACAPPLQGCSPIVREGHCCPSTYNCRDNPDYQVEFYGNPVKTDKLNVQGGSIEVKATQNYASYAFISKDYAKFRKETNFFPAMDQTTNLPVEGRGHRVVEERIDSSTINLEEDASVVTDSTSWPSTFETDTMNNEIMVETMDYAKSNLEVTTSLLVEETTTNVESTTPETTSNDDVVEESSTTRSTIVVFEESTILTTEDSSFVDSTTESTTMPSGLNVSSTGEEKEEEVNVIERNRNVVSTNFTELGTSDEDDLGYANFTNYNETCCNRTRATEATEPTEAKGTGAGKPSSTILMPDDILVMNVTVKTNVSVGHIQGVTINPIRSIPPDVEAILNITHREKGEDYDYDYSEPTLPPSLPNVRIIPFVAADALVKDKTVPSPVTGYPPGSVVVPPELRPTDTSGFYDMATQENRFSPPVETEGGFVPREPPYFDGPYRSTDLNLEIGTGVTVVPAPITNPHRKNDVSNCLLENLEYRHGEILPSNGICVICMCYYGEVVCTTEKCPPLKIGCRRLNTDEVCCGKIVCVNAEESPTVVLDRADATAPSHHQPMVSPDPFRDVIKTEPAPDLPSLIEDMIPYLVEHGITTSRATSTTTSKPKQTQPSNHPQRPNFDYIEKLPLPPSYDYREEPSDRLISKNKYANQDTLPKGSSAYKDADREASNVDSESSEIGPPDYEGITLTRTNETAKEKEDNPVVLGNGTKSNSTKSLENVGTSIVKKVEESVKITEDTRATSTTVSPGEIENPIFSLDSVLDLLFSSDTAQMSESTSETTTSIVENRTIVSTEIGVAESSTIEAENVKGTLAETETPSKLLDNEIPMSVASLLKLAGCNIYGRMYRVGRIITELSGPCLECRCTEIGVQCKQLECR